MPKYIYSRSSVFEEVFTVTAQSEAEALDLVSDGAPSITIEQRGWVGWADEEYTLEETEDEVVTFLHSKESA